jgi:hypothetical protein
LEENGLPVFTLPYENDDDSYRKQGSDSRLTFTAPADGDYLVRVTDVRGFQGDRYAYRLILRRPQPDFNVSLADFNKNVNRGSGRRFTVTAHRIDEFDGDIRVDITGLPSGFEVSSPLVIQAGHLSAQGVLFARGDTTPPDPADWDRVQIKAVAMVDDSEVSRVVNGFGHVTLADPPQLEVALSPSELTIAPGTTITAHLAVKRNGFEDRISFDVSNLPHGVIVDNIGLNGVLIPEGQTERTIYLTAEHWVPETSRTFQATADGDGGQTSLPITLHVRRAPAIAHGP